MVKKVRVFGNFKDAQEAEIREQIAMTPAQRLEIFRQLRIRVYGRKPIDIKTFHKKRK